MDYNIEDINIKNRLTELNLILPSNLAFFPENFEEAEGKEKFIFTESLADLNKIFKQKNINLEVFGQNTELYRTRKNADIYLPAIFLSLSIITENPSILTVSLNLLSSYVFERIKGSIGRKTVQIEFYIETKEKGKLKKLSYKGDAEGIEKLEKVIKTF